MQRRKTPARTAILSQFQSANTALSHEMLEQRLGERVNRATIYRILKRLTADGIVHRIVTTEGIQYFALCAQCGENDHRHQHLHFRCVSCDRMECLEQDIKYSLPAGYQPMAFNATISGLCRACASSDD